MHWDLIVIYEKYFKFIETDHGFEIIHSQYDRFAFGNFIIEFQKDNNYIRIISDRSQIFIEIKKSDSDWIHIDKIYEKNGILFSRYNVTNGLWDGYDIKYQSKDLKDYFDLLFVD